MTNQKHVGDAAPIRKREIQMPALTMTCAPLLVGVAHLLSDCRTEPGQDIRSSIKSWLISVMKRKKWSAERWAREADISGTTITRFLNSDDPHRTPSSKTLDKLARAAGVPVMQSHQQILIPLVRRNSLLDEARRLAPNPVDLFSMPADEYIPAPDRYADCRLQEMDNGQSAICHTAAPKFGKRVVVVNPAADSVALYRYTPPLLVPAEGNQMADAIPSDSPGIQILSRARGLYQHFADEDDEE